MVLRSGQAGCLRSLLLTVAKSDLHQRQNRVVTLLRALERQQVIIRATGAGRELATYFRPAVVYGAPALDRIENLAGLSEDRVGLAPQYLFPLPRGRVSFLRRFIINPGMLCHAGG